MNISVIQITSDILNEKQTCQSVEILATLNDSESGCQFRLPTVINLDPPTDEFIEYSELSEEVVLEWCYDKLHNTVESIDGKDISRYTKLQQDVQSGLDTVILNKSVNKELPWAPSEISDDTTEE